MKISSKSRYALLFLTDLAENGSQNQLTLANIAEKHDISARYLEQVAISLRKSGFVRSVKGFCGGYSLAKSPENIQLIDIIKTIEGDSFIEDDFITEKPETKYLAVIRRMIFERLNKESARLIERFSLASLIRSGGDYMYFI